MLVNPYTPGTQFKNFPKLHEEIANYYDFLYDTVPGNEFLLMTARYKLESGKKIGFKDVFYYINLLYENNPKSVIDVGCGECIWKKWFPNIIGFDPGPSEWSAADFVDFFDEDFSKGHTKNYDCGMGLNSLHFIEWKDILKQINLAMNIVNDRFLFTFNFNVIRNKPNLPVPELILLFDEFINASGYKIILLDYPYLRNITDSMAVNEWTYINGHVRFILQHN
jgi:hypothetical protein